MPGETRSDAALGGLLRVSACLGLRDHSLLVPVLEEARHLSDPREIEEVLMQNHLFVGYPVAMNALAAWRELEPTPSVSDTLEAAGVTAGGTTVGELEARGEQLCRQVYGSTYEGLRTNVAALHPALDQWMCSVGYGWVLSRPQLDAVTRELCVVALLAVLDVPPQLYSHLRGSLNVGAAPAQVQLALDAAAQLADSAPESGSEARKSVRNARDMWLEVETRWTSRQSVQGRPQRSST